MSRTIRRALAVVTLIFALGALLIPPAGAWASSDAAPAPSKTVPVYAYFYQWFNHSSWRRAKVDYPLAGRYTSDDQKVLEAQITQAKAAGLDGFLTSWKSTTTLNRRLQLLLKLAHAQDFGVGVVYEALDFQRRPLPIATVRRDMVELITRWGDQLGSTYFDRPLIIWTGTQHYTTADIRSVRAALGNRAYLLATAKSAAAYQRIAGLVDGDAYYWSSARPGTSYTQDRLASLAAAVHQHHGLWLASATAGFDGRTLGHTRVIPRNDGRALTRSLGDAFGSHPDAVGVISWNEWSENTYIEPGRRYGRQELDTLSRYLHRFDTPMASPVVRQEAAASEATPSRTTGAGLRAAIVLAAGTTLAGILLLLRARFARREW